MSLLRLSFALTLCSFATLLNCPVNAQPLTSSPSTPDATNLTKSTQVNAFKLHGFIEGGQGNYEVWLERRDRKWKLLRQHQAGQNDESELQRRTSIKLAESTGGIVQSIVMFDGTNSIDYSPGWNQVRIAPTEKNSISFIDRLLFPESWSSFTPGAKSEKLKFAYLMGLQSANKSIDTKVGGKIVVITEASASDDPISFKTRTLELDVESGLPIRSKMSGGKGLANTLEFSWEKAGDVYFVKRGSYEIEGQKPWSWTIDSYTTDASQIASQFTLDELNLPIGTKINTHSVSRKTAPVTTFIGGQEGEKEYKLKQQKRIEIINLEAEGDQ